MAKIAKRAVAILVIISWTLSPLSLSISVSSTTKGVSLSLEVKEVAAYGDGFTFRRPITINESQVTGTANLSNFPVYINVSDPTFRHTNDGGNVTSATGLDIIFASDDQAVSQLDHELESYTSNSSTGVITAWVRIDPLDFNDNTVIYMFYGKSGASDTSDAPGVWDPTNYEGVWHMDESSGAVTDSTGNTNNASLVNSPTETTGKLGNALQFNGTSNYVTVADHATLDLTTAGTIEAWMNTTSTTTSTNSFTAWATHGGPTLGGSAQADNYMQADSVIVGDTMYIGALSCRNTGISFHTATLGLATTSTFSGWTSRATSTMSMHCQTGEGVSIGVESDGMQIWYSALNNTAGTLDFRYSTSSLDMSNFSAWKDPGADPSSGSDAESSSVDMAITGNRAYFGANLVSGTTDDFDTAYVNLNGSGWTGWAENTVSGFLSTAAGEGCGVGVDANGATIYYASQCNSNGTYTFSTGYAPLGGTISPAWGDGSADPTGGGGDEHGFNDVAYMGDHLYHVNFGLTAGTELYAIASSTTGSPHLGLTWTTLQNNSLPNGGATSASGDPSVESDGKNLFFTAYAHNGTTQTFYTASSTLASHPIVSKFGAYEMIQVGSGFAFDWSGRPASFGTTTAPDTWKHVVVAHSGTVISYYVNGALVASTTVATSTAKSFSTNANALQMGTGFLSSGARLYFPGMIDEVRVASEVKSSAWIQTQYNNQSSTSTFYTLGAQSADLSVPTVSTRAATNVGASGANVNGAIISDGGGSIIDHGFAYGTSANLTTNTATTSMGALSLSEFSQATTTLSAATTYYYRAYAANAGGDGLGAIRSFTTGNATIARKMRLFESGRIRFVDGRFLLNQQ